MRLNSQKINSKALEGNLRDQSFWLESLSDIPEVEPLRGSVQCDIAIIGGGFTGLSTAYHARKLIPGADVRVLEANMCAFGSSGRNAGASGTLFGLAKTMTASKFGKENAIAAHYYMEDAADYMDHLIHEYSINCDYEKNGNLIVATTPSQVKRIDHELRIVGKWGLEGFEAWNEARLNEEFHTRMYRRGMFESRSAILNPALLARGLMRIAKQAGAIIHEMSPAISINEVSNGFCIQTPEGELRANRLVYATNAYSILFPSLLSKQTPIFQHIVLSEPLSDAQLNSIGWKSRCGLEDARMQIHYYRLTADNRILMGGGNISPVFGRKLHRDSNQKVFAHLKRHVIDIYPQLNGLQFTHQWGGVVSITINMIPAIGYVDNKKRALFALGYMGHGVSMGTYNGLCLAELLADQKSKRTDMFFVGHKIKSWPPQVIRYPLLQGARALLKIGDKFLWD